MSAKLELFVRTQILSLRSRKLLRTEQAVSEPKSNNNNPKVNNARLDLPL